MDTSEIDGIVLTPLRRILHPKGDILHAMKQSDAGFAGFGEAYFSTVKSGEIKGWSRHKRMTLNLIVPIGKVAFVVYDGRTDSSTKGNCFRTELSVDVYQRLTVAPGLWVAFKGLGAGDSFILNIADIEHDPLEVEKLDLDQIEYDWDFV